MKAPAFVHRGRVQARAVVVDVGLLGEAEARRRVLGMLGPGAEVRALDERAWLVLLGDPADMRTAQAPGLVLTQEGDSLVGAPGIGAGEGGVALFDSGTVRTLDRSAGRPIDPSTWIELGDLPLVRLRPLVRPDVPVPIEPVVAERVDLRTTAGIGERSDASRAIEASLRGGPSAPGWLARLRRVLGGAGPRRDGRGGGDGRGPAAGFRPSGPPGLFERLANGFAALLAATPLGDRARRRQAAYVEHLLRELEESTGEGLRHALPLGGEGSVGLASLRLPPRRETLDIGPEGTRRGPGVGVGPTAYQVLSLAYRRAAERLEEEGRIEEAAFVWVELLGEVARGVEMLARHEAFALAARVAEMRDLAPALRIRLWWKAHDRERAIAIARRHALFGDVIERASGDPELARALRAAWIESLEQAGDLAGALAAGWPDPVIRPHLAGLVRRGLALGGPAGAAMRAYRLALRPDEGELDETRAWLDARGADDAAEVRALLLAFATIRLEPAADREFASRLQRAVLRVRWPAATDPTLRAPLHDLRDRVDRVLAADLPGLARRPASAEHGLVAPRQPAGLVAIADAAALPSGQTLVALGERGCILLSPSGRTAARWDVPAERIVLADHGTAALLVSERGRVVAVTRLDLADRRVRPYGVVSAGGFAESYDGGLWPVADDRGLAFLDLLADRPTVAWRELDPGWSCASLARSHDQLTAVVVIRGPDGRARLQQWTWSLPGIELRSRYDVEARQPLESLVLLIGTSLVWKPPGEEARAGTSGTGIPWFGRDRGLRVLGSAAALALVADTFDGSELRVHRTITDQVPALTVPLGPVSPGFRASGTRVAAWDGQGRLVTADLDAARLITVTRLT